MCWRKLQFRGASVDTDSLVHHCLIEAFDRGSTHVYYDRGTDPGSATAGSPTGDWVARQSNRVPFDRLTSLAVTILRAPIALISLVDEDRQFFKSQVGLPSPWSERRQTPLSHSFCKNVVAERKPLIVQDAREHPTLCRNGAVADLNVISYLGVPLTTPNGEVIGSFCVIDGRRREWRDDDLQVLRDLSNCVMSEVKLRTEMAEKKRAEQKLLEGEARLRGILDSSLDALITIDYRGVIVEFNPSAERIFGVSALRLSVSGFPTSSSRPNSGSLMSEVFRTTWRLARVLA